MPAQNQMLINVSASSIREEEEEDEEPQVLKLHEVRQGAPTQQKRDERQLNLEASLENSLSSSDDQEDDDGNENHDEGVAVHRNASPRPNLLAELMQMAADDGPVQPDSPMSVNLNKSNFHEAHSDLDSDDDDSGVILSEHIPTEGDTQAVNAS